MEPHAKRPPRLKTADPLPPETNAPPPPKKTSRPVIIAALFFAVLATLVLFLTRQALSFSQSAHVPLFTVLQTAKSAWLQKLTPKNGGHTLVFLVLGTNRITGREFVPEITDSMILLSLNLKTGRIGLFSLPRDIWSTPYQTKIDAFYVYGHDLYPQQPERFPTEVVQELTGIPVDYTIVLSPENFANIIDAFGGVYVNVPQAFTDPQFPNPEVDVRTTQDPNLLYMTVQFQKGIQLLNGQRALEYVRSRHSPGEEGTDIARSRRQREVITDLLSQLQQPQYYTNVTLLGQLYALYNTDFAHYLPTDKLLAIAKALYPLRKKLYFVENGPSLYPDNPQGAIYHPPFSPLADGQWVYLIRDPHQFQAEAQAILFSEDGLR